ncbi:MAG TPA: DUF962 domain-containing protein [Blastocatellia bacterium]|nr:DUF962 domain-containing protein [Blastocatellia bacterium]
MSQEQRFKSFEEFWPFYVSEHRRPANRLLHFSGSSAGLICLVAALIMGKLWLIVPALVIGYACAWTGHFFVEHNRPATFKYPLWSFAADWKMWALTLAGRMNDEVRRAEKTA